MPLTNERLPDDVLAAIEDVNVPNKIKSIGTKHELHFDQIGILGEEVESVMRGQIHPDEFVARIEDRLGVTTEKAIDIATDVNIEIFLSIRQSLMSMHEAEKTEEMPTETSIPMPPTPKPSPTAENMSSREDILADIEDPSPAIHPISAADQGIPRPASKTEITPEDNAAAKSFIAGKLSETVSVPPKKTIFEEKQVPQKPKGYSADPYREPIS